MESPQFLFVFFLLLFDFIFFFNVSNSQDDVDVDDLLPQIGEFGRYQKLLIWLVCLPACIPCGFGAFNQLFMQQTPDHWCRIPDLMHLSMASRRDLGVPSLGVGIAFLF